MPVISSPLLPAAAAVSAAPVIISSLPQEPTSAASAQATQAAPPGAAQAATILGLGGAGAGPGAVATANAVAKAPMPAPNLLQSIQQPLPQTSLGASGASTSQGLGGLGRSAATTLQSHEATPLSSSSTTAPQFSSQISRETADADRQISQLLENLQKEPQALTIGRDEKMADFIKSLAGESAANAGTPTTPEVIRAKNAAGLAAPALPPPVPTAVTSLASLVVDPPAQAITARPAAHPASKAQKAAVEKTSGTTGFQASFLNSLANRRVSAEEESMKQQQQQFVGGGASSQMRALQNLPPNTRLVKGPNGQYQLQKIQTIELTAEQQAVRKDGIAFNTNFDS